MTEEEAAKAAVAKAEATERLEMERARLGKYRLGEVDARLQAYILDVAKRPEGHNLYEQLAALRFLRMCRKYGLNRYEVRFFFSFYESLTFPNAGGARRYQLTPVQAMQFASIFGFWDGPRRIVREACLYVPRKFSKTTSTASLAVLDLLYGDANAEAYVGANSQDQAKKCFDVIRQCVRRLDPSGARYRVNKQAIESRREDREAFAQCLTANARTKDGLNASTTIMDEFSQARDMGLLSVLTTSMGARLNPLTAIITTASDVFDGPFYSMLAGYKGLLLGEYEDDSVFAHIFEPDAGDAEDDPRTWAKVHPHLGVTIQPGFYEQEHLKAMRGGAEAMLAFRTKLLNVYAENERKAWISATLARSISRPIRLDRVKGSPTAMVAIDLSVSGDFSAVTAGLYFGEDRYCFITDYFFPEGALCGHPNEKLYRAWASRGYLRLCPGDTMDYSMIVEHVIVINRYAKVRYIGFDPYKSITLTNMLSTYITSQGGNAEATLRPVKQATANFTAPVEAFEHGAKTGKITINDNPINAYCFGNAVLMFDTLENCKPVKRTESQRIDGVITKLMALRLFIDDVRPQIYL